MRLHLIAALGLTGAVALADPVQRMTGGDIVTRCLSCHLTETGEIDIVGLSAMESLPEEWPFLFEDAFDMNDDGIAGVMRFVTGTGGARAGIFGEALAAGRFEDFASIAAGAHGIVIRDAAEMARIRAAFEARSPDPDLPDPSALAQFEARGCAACHVTHSFEHEGRAYMPLSDFLLHDLGDGPKRTAPLWGCPDCLTAPAHPHPTRPGPTAEATPTAP